MTNRREPFLPLFVGDFLGSTGEWSGEAQSLYLLLLAHQWAVGSLPVETEKLARLSRWDRRAFLKCWETVKVKFVERDGRLYNQRLEEHREHAASIHSKRTGAGKAGAEARWPKTGKTVGTTRSERLSAARALGTHTPTEWAAMQEACGHRCVMCQASAQDLIGESFCKDHVVPIYAGGSDAIGNIQPTCRNCNSKKGGDSTDYRPSGWQERLAKCLAKRLQNASHQSINQEEDSEAKASGASAPLPLAGKEPSASLDQALFSEGRKVFGQSCGGLLNQAIRAKGKPWLVQMIETCRPKDPEAARAYLKASMTEREQRADRFNTA